MDRLKNLINRYFINDDLPFDSKILNFVCFLGVLASGSALIARLIAGLPFITMSPLVLMILAISGVLLISAKGAKRASVLTTIIVFAVSIIFWPILFFTIGGPNSGMAVYFALAIILDFTLLKGKTRLFALLLTIVITVICYISTLFWGLGVLPVGGLSTYQLFIDIMQSILIVGFLMGIIIMYQTRLYRNERQKVELVSKETEHNKELLVLINDAAVILLSDSTDEFETTISQSMGRIAQYLGIDCVYIWRADERDGVSVYIKLYYWESHNGETTKTFEEVSGSNVLMRVPEWDDKLFGEQGYISGSLGSFTGYMHEVLSDCGIKSIMAFPVFFQGEYWGFISFGNKSKDKLCSEREAVILKSGSLLLVNAIGRNENITQLKSAQRTVSAMFNANPHMNILFNDKFELVDCNPAAVLFFGFNSKEELFAGFVERVTKSIPQFQPDGRPSIPLAQRLVTAVKEGFVKFETELHLADDVRRILDVEFKRIPYGDSFAVVGYVYDMTEIHEREKELKHRDQQLRVAMEEATEANLAKSNFLATMSHEIRTPMNAIIGITEIQLQKEALDEDTRDALNKIYVSGDMLLGIINDILDLSKIEAGKLELVTDKYEIASLISDTAQLNVMRIGSKPIEFELDVNENVPAILLGDELRVKQVLNNVLSNAFKYTASGTVRLSVSVGTGNDRPSAASRASGKGDSAVTLILCVSDTGQGMTKEQIDKLFDQYARFNMETNRATEGTGLGMSITRNLVRLMNGEIYIESEPGVGTKVVMSIPQNKSGSGTVGKDIAENLRNFRSSSRAQMKRVQITREPMPDGSVLIVDDVETNIYVARGLLAPYELKIDSAESGFAAIEKIKSGAVYDIVFMDHMMPKMDGIEATRIIRDIGYKHPIVALTANAVSGQSDIFLGNGFDDFISKPIDIRQLNTVLNRLIRDKRPSINPVINQRPNGDAQQPPLSQRFAKVFARDAKKTLAVLCDVLERGNLYNDENDLQTFVVYVHGMKSALANIGRMELSAIALKLETLARNGDVETIISESPAFLDALRCVAEELSPEYEPESEPENACADEAELPYLREKLIAIKVACEEFDEKTAEDIIAELRMKPLSQTIRELLSSVDEFMLHSDFDEISDTVNKFLETL